jgi:hypothetical protein
MNCVRGADAVESGPDVTSIAISGRVLGCPSVELGGWSVELGGWNV